MFFLNNLLEFLIINSFMITLLQSGNETGGELISLDYIARIIIVSTRVSVGDSFSSHRMCEGGKMYVIIMSPGLFPNLPALLWEEGT